MEEKKYGKPRRGKSNYRSKRYSDNKSEESESNSEFRNNPKKKHFGNRDRRKTEFSESPEKGKRFSKDSEKGKNKFSSKPRKKFEDDSPEKEDLRKRHYSKKKQLEHAMMQGPKDGILRLNKYIANAGECSRREADKRIEAGRVTVNDKLVTEVGTKVKLDDKVCLDGVLLHPESKVYLVLNKPKDFVTTLDDPLGRKKVTDLIKNACSERVYPVGRLDRMTTGVLLFTNDGDLTKRLTHPSYNRKKIYHVFLEREILQEDLDMVMKGLELEDGLIKADAISHADPNDKKQVGIEIHSGKNRIVRRIFEHLGYDVVKLDRVYFAGITKKNIPRGKWRFLTEEEVNILKNF